MWQRYSDEDKRGSDKGSFLSHSEYVEVYNKWHLSLGAAFIGCLKSNEYIHNRTGLILLMRMVTHFPTKSTLGEKIIDTLKPLQKDNNPMQDIRAMAQAYSSQLVKARGDGVWKEENKRAAKERLEREKQIQEEKRMMAEKRSEEMEEDTKQLARQLGDGRDRGDRNDRRRTERPMPPQQSRNGGDRGVSPLPADLRQNQNDRGSATTSNKNMEDRWKRDRPGPSTQRPHAHEQNRRRGENRGDNRNQDADNDASKSLHGRWEGNSVGTNTNENIRKSKRDRSPDNRPKSGRGNSLDREQKRRRDASPPHRRHRNNRGR